MRLTAITIDETLKDVSVNTNLIGNAGARLVPCSFLPGAILFAVSGILSRSVFAPVEIGGGSITALLGGVFFVWVTDGPLKSVHIWF